MIEMKPIHRCCRCHKFLSIGTEPPEERQPLLEVKGLMDFTFTDLCDRCLRTVRNALGRIREIAAGSTKESPQEPPEPTQPPDPPPTPPGQPEAVQEPSGAAEDLAVCMALEPELRVADRLKARRDADCPSLSSCRVKNLTPEQAARYRVVLEGWNGGGEE